MVHVTRQFEANAEQAAAIEYLKDFGNATQWDPGSVSNVRIDDGPVGVGSQWHNTSKLLFINTELTYELTDLRENGITFTGTNKTATSVDTIDVLPGTRPGSVRITYDSNVTFNGKAKYGDPFITLIFLKLAGETVDGITRELQRR
ncbi:MAG: SRPBCC family protein [Ornithinimicrobium sp.]